MSRERNAWIRRYQKGESKGILLVSAKEVAGHRIMGEMNGRFAVQWGARG